jgi:hypothetical protein
MEALLLKWLSELTDNYDLKKAYSWTTPPEKAGLFTCAKSKCYSLVIKNESLDLPSRTQNNLNNRFYKGGISV